MSVLIGVALACTACESKTIEAASTQPPLVDEARARTLALYKYRQLFTDKYMRNPVDDKYYPFPPLTESDFQFVEASGDAWIVRCDPPAGYSVAARVAKSGEWVELLRVGFAAM